MATDRGARTDTRQRRVMQRANSEYPFDLSQSLSYNAATGILSIVVAAPLVQTIAGIGIALGSGLVVVANALAAKTDPAPNLLTLGAAGLLVSNTLALDLKLGTVGKGLYIKEGTNATMGTAVLVGGTVTVATTKVTANSRVFISRLVAGGTRGFLEVGTITPGTSFVINATDAAGVLAADTSTIAWVILEPA